MRILHALDSLESGGAQRVAIGLIEWLVARGETVVVLARDGELVGSLPEGVKTVLATSTPDYVAKMWTLVRSFSPDIIHAHQRKEAQIARFVAVHNRSLRVVEHAHTRFPSIDHRRISFRSDAIFAVSTDVAEMLVGDFQVPGERVVLVENTPASTSSLPPSPNQRPASSAPLCIVGIGRLTEQKDPFRFVETVAALAKRTAVSAVWVGDGPLKAAAEERAHLIAAPITFVGFQQNVVQYIDQADLLLMTSRWEGLPLVALEAMARERLVVAPALPSLVDLIGSTRGIVYPIESDGHDIAERLANSPREMWPTLAEAGRVHLARRQSSDENNARILRRYAELVGR